MTFCPIQGHTVHKAPYNTMYNIIYLDKDISDFNTILNYLLLYNYNVT